MDKENDYEFRPRISEKNFLLVQKLANSPVTHSFNKSLSIILKEFSKK